MLALATPARLSDCLDTVAPHGACLPMLWAITRYQLTRGRSYAIRDEEGRALAIGGFWEEPDYREVWTAIAPRACTRTRELVAMARLTLLDLPQDDPRPVMAVARTPAGARLAALLGFERRTETIFVWAGRDGRCRKENVRRR